VNDLDARRVGLDDERGDLLASLPVRQHLVGVRAITTNRSARVPLVHQSFSPLISSATVLDGRGRGGHVRRIGAGVDFRERERADRALGEHRKELALLLFGAKQLQWLGNANGLAGDSRAVSDPSFDVTSSMART